MIEEYIDIDWGERLRTQALAHQARQEEQRQQRANLLLRRGLGLEARHAAKLERNRRAGVDEGVVGVRVGGAAGRADVDVVGVDEDGERHDGNDVEGKHHGDNH